MATFRYRGSAYRQSPLGDSPWIVSFVTSAEELLQWAGIPRRSEENFAGFQRGEDPVRVSKAKDFFSMPQNQSPTALIVGIHPDGDAPRVHLTFDDDDNEATIRACW